MEQSRIRKLVSLLEEKDLDAIVITYPVNLRYFTGFRGDNGVLLVRRDYIKFFTDGRYTTQAVEEISCCEIFEARGIYDVVRKELKSGESIGIDGIGINFSQYRLIHTLVSDIKLFDASEEIHYLRAKKEDWEIKLIKRAVNVQEKTINEVLVDRLWEKMTEKELSVFIKCKMLEYGADEEAFDTIVAYDRNSALPHAIPGQNVFAGDIVLIDWGCKINGYNSDQTVTRINENNPDISNMYKIVKEAHDAAIDAIKPEIPARDLDQIARSVISTYGYGDYFSHSLGHGVGLEVHERPWISSNSKDVIEVGMVFTIEPGIYIPGKGGIRLEDMVYVSENGVILLTQIDK